MAQFMKNRAFLSNKSKAVPIASIDLDTVLSDEAHATGFVVCFFAELDR